MLYLYAILLIVGVGLAGSDLPPHREDDELIINLLGGFMLGVWAEWTWDRVEKLKSDATKARWR